MVDGSMKTTGLLFFIMRTTRLIVAMLVLFAICKPAVANVAIKGADNLAPNCEDKIKELCKNTTLGPLQEVTVKPRDCKAICTYKPPGEDTEIVNNMPVRNRKYEQVTLPQGMPCAFGAKCDNNGKCICKFCNEGNANKKPAST
uniref:Putative salp15 n=1 Tax=Ixodes ricinus TaxID=34613 RepID=A0A0K8R9U0_IXORI